jgi:hypothetical protein
MSSVESAAKASPGRRIARSVGAIVLGLLVTVILSTGVDAILHATGVFPPMGQAMSDGLFSLALAYRLVFDTLGCYVAARLAPRNPMAHAWILGGIGMILATAGALATWNRGPEFGPHWYALALIVTTPPCAWLGGKLAFRK